MSFARGGWTEAERLSLIAGEMVCFSRWFVQYIFGTDWMVSRALFFMLSSCKMARSVSACALGLRSNLEHLHRQAGGQLGLQMKGCGWWVLGKKDVFEWNVRGDQRSEISVGLGLYTNTRRQKLWITEKAREKVVVLVGWFVYCNFRCKLTL